MADYNEPLLAIPNHGRFSPDTILLSFTAGWARGEPRGPETLASIYDVRAGPAPKPAAAMPTDTEEAPYVVGHGGTGRFDRSIQFDDVVAYEEEDRVEHLLAALAWESGVEEVVHEDRELVLVRAPRLDDRTFEAAVSRIWRSSREV